MWRLWGVWCWYLHVCRVVFIIASAIPRLVCISWGEMRVHSYVPFSWLHTTVVLLTTFNIYNLGYKLVWFLREKRWVMSGKMTNPLKTVLLPRLWWRLGCVCVCLSVSLPSGDSPVVGTSSLLPDELWWLARPFTAQSFRFYEQTSFHPFVPFHVFVCTFFSPSSAPSEANSCPILFHFLLPTFFFPHPPNSISSSF